MINLSIHYPVHVKAWIEISSLCQKIIAKEGQYFLKFYLNNQKEALFQELSHLSLSFVSLPLQNVYQQYISEEDGLYFALFPYYEEDETDLEEAKLKYYFLSLGELHQKSEYVEEVQPSFLDEILLSLENSHNQMVQLIDNFMEKIEKNSYHSPFEWFFILNYHHLHLALDEVNRRLDLLEEKWKEKPKIRLGLVYGHYDPSHILLHAQKIVSWDNVQKNPIIYDLIYMIGQIKNMRMDMTALFESYFQSIELNEVEKLWLSIYLLTPTFQLENDEIQQIKTLNLALKHLYVGEKLVSYLEEHA